MTAAHARFIGEFYGSFFAWVSLAGLLFQSFFVSRIFKAIGPGGALFVGPAIALVGYSVILAAPVLTARQALFLPVARPVSCIRERLWGLRYTLSLRSIWRSRAFWIWVAAGLARDHKKQSHRRSQQLQPASEEHLQVTPVSSLR